MSWKQRHPHCKQWTTEEWVNRLTHTGRAVPARRSPADRIGMLHWKMRPVSIEAHATQSSSVIHALFLGQGDGRNIQHGRVPHPIVLRLNRMNQICMPYPWFRTSSITAERRTFGRTHSRPGLRAQPAGWTPPSPRFSDEGESVR